MKIIKSYWMDYVTGVFANILDNLKGRLNSPQIQALVEIEGLLINAIFPHNAEMKIIAHSLENKMLH